MIFSRRGAEAQRKSFFKAMKHRVYPNHDVPISFSAVLRARQALEFVI
jgi:hypothetical protein